MANPPCLLFSLSLSVLLDGYLHTVAWYNWLCCHCRCWPYYGRLHTTTSGPVTALPRTRPLNCVRYVHGWSFSEQVPMKYK